MSALQEIMDEKCEMEMTPMIDVTFLLLIFLIFFFVIPSIHIFFDKIPNWPSNTPMYFLVYIGAFFGTTRLICHFGETLGDSFTGLLCSERMVVRPDAAW